MKLILNSTLYSCFLVSSVAAAPSKVRGCRRGSTGCKVTCPVRLAQFGKSNHFCIQDKKMKWKQKTQDLAWLRKIVTIKKKLQHLTTFLLSYPQNSLESKYLCVKCHVVVCSWVGFTSNPHQIMSLNVTCAFLVRLFDIHVLRFPNASRNFPGHIKTMSTWTNEVWEATWHQDLTQTLPHTWCCRP